MVKHAEDLQLYDLDPIRFNLLLPLGSISVRALTYPAFLVKARLQASTPQGGVFYISTRHAFTTIFRKEGLRSFYKGFGLSLSTIPLSVIYMNLMELFKSSMIRSETLAIDSPYLPLVSSGAASMLVQFIGVPIDVVVQRLMVRRGPEKLKVSSVVSSIYRSEGLVGFYRGLPASIATFTPHSMIVWTIYTNTRSMLRNSQKDLSSAKETVFTAFSGLLAGCSAALLMNPVDVIRTRQQVQTEKIGVWDTCLLVYKERGLKGFSRGMNARVLATGPTAMLALSGYEIVKLLSRV